MPLKPEDIEYLKTAEGIQELTANNLIPATEPAKLTEEGVNKFIEGNTEFKTKLTRTAVTSYLGEKLGVTEKVEELLDKPIMLATETEKYKKVAVAEALGGVKYPELLLGKLDMGKITFGENKLEGLEEQLTALKTTYPDLFITDPKQTPPPPARKEPEGEKEKIKSEIERLSKLSKSTETKAKLLALEIQLAKLNKE